ncbi:MULTISPECIES: hypothetical protein [unclassified Nonomuraea]|uniref:hypothetical protein n=1 Tax=unclassified Nonomuraea TaxID=2593643 RepID=UPI0033E0CBEB
MTGTSVRRPLLLAASVVLPVGGAVAGNQILNDGQWSWWWALIAVALSAACAWVTHRLTRTAKGSAAVAGQLVSGSTVGGGVTQVKGVTGTLRLGPPSSPAPAPQQPAAEASEPVSPAPETGQTVTRTRIGGEVVQVDGVGGDAEIDR